MECRNYGMLCQSLENLLKHIDPKFQPDLEFGQNAMFISWDVGRQKRNQLEQM